MQSILPAVLSYARECWVGGTKEILSKLEQSYKQMIYSIFGFGEKTKYSAVMLELGLLKMKHVVARFQIAFMSEVLWDLEDSTLNKVILQKFELLGEKSSLAIVDKLAQDYGFEKVSTVRIDKKVLNRQIRLANNQENWFDCYQSSSIPVRHFFRIYDKSHFAWEKLKAKAILAYRCGTLKFKTCWRLYNLKRGKGIDCPNILCGKEDSILHAQKCLFYNTRWDDKFNDSEQEFAEYLLRLNRERISRYRLPII